MKSVTIRQALQRVADYPEPNTDVYLQLPAHELICRTLFQIANRPDPSVRGSMTRANTARKIILDRLGGRRRSGTRPVSSLAAELDFIDLTGVEVASGPAEETAPDEDQGSD